MPKYYIIYINLKKKVGTTIFIQNAKYYFQKDENPESSFFGIIGRSL